VAEVVKQHACYCVACQPEEFPDFLNGKTHLAPNHFSADLGDRWIGSDVRTYLDHRLIRQVKESMVGDEGWVWYYVTDEPDLADSPHGYHMCRSCWGDVCMRFERGKVELTVDGRRLYERSYTD
jgi:hypothetical protein